MADILYGLAPIADARSRVLILGNMPSAMSLASQQYYGNPRNAFWRITAEILGFDHHAPHLERVTALQNHGVAVWDVLRSCRRVGSLDSAVERDTMVPNAFDAFFAKHDRITRLVFNGAAAEANFRRLVAEPPMPTVRVPSTSPAQTMRYADKLAAWRAALGV